MNRTRLAGLPEALFALAVLTVTGPGALALDLPDTATRTAFSALGFGSVSAIVPSGNVTYIGGNFEALAAITGAFARLDASTGKRAVPIAEAEDGEVRASVPDGKGGFYIGGTFTQLGGERRDRIGHILADGSVDSLFNPSVPGQSSAINALAISGDGRTLYVGGSFGYIAGALRNNLAALEAANGKLTSFNPAGLGTDGPVFALEVSGTQVYVGGDFAKLGGQTRNGLAKLAGTTGGDLGWIPNPMFGPGVGRIRAIKASADAVFVGGVFSTIGGQTRSNLAKLSPITGAALPNFAPNPDDAVFALVLAGGSLYVGGSFNAVDRQDRPAVVRMSATTGTLAGLNAKARSSDTVHALALAGSELYVGGLFPDLGNPAVKSKSLVKVDANTGAGISAFKAGIGNFDATVAIKTIALAGTSVYVGGDFLFVNKVIRHGIAALDSDGVPTAFDPDAGSDALNDVYAIAVRGNDIYLGGSFKTMGGQRRNRIAKVSKAGVLDPNFNPNITGGNPGGVATIVVTSTDVFVGGNFSAIGGQPRVNLAKVNPITGLVDAGRRSFDPDPVASTSSGRVSALQVLGDDVYVSGNFTSIGGAWRNQIAKISAATGDADVSFNANVSGGSAYGPNIDDVVLARETLFVAGDFSLIGGAARNNVATLNPKTGGEVTGFNPNVTGGQRPTVYRIRVTDQEVYIGGFFTHVGGQAQSHVARLTRTGASSAFEPRVADAVVALATSNTTLYVGGLFYKVGGRQRLEYAQFTQPLTLAVPGALDLTAPTSAIEPLDGVQERAMFPVAWAGEDGGAGVRDYSVFVAADGGPFEPWLTNTSATSALWLGANGQTYEFYSTARDLSGNVEAKDAAAEATTTVMQRADDGDGDGVPDEEDRCTDRELSPTVVIDALDTGVANVLARPAGCSLADRVAMAEDGALNRRVFVRRVARLIRTWLREGLVDQSQADALAAAAAQTTTLSP